MASQWIALLVLPCLSFASLEICMQGPCDEVGPEVEPTLMDEGEGQALQMLQMKSRKSASVGPESPTGGGEPAQGRATCKVGDDVKCPGSDRMCAGSQCCPGTPATQNKSFPCPSAPFDEAAGCDTRTRVDNCAPCLCSFDVDRTLTGKQDQLGHCPKDHVLPIEDWAYGGGNLTLSPVGQSLEGTFCAKYACYVAIVTAGDAGGEGSEERKELEKVLGETGRLVSPTWSGPSKVIEARALCDNITVDSTLVAGCIDGTKQFAVASVVAWLEETKNVTVAPAGVWHFDDRTNNIAPFEGTGFNAREVSCGSRDNGKGYCGADIDEIVDEPGVILCPPPVKADGDVKEVDGESPTALVPATDLGGGDGESPPPLSQEVDAQGIDGNSPTDPEHHVDVYEIGEDVYQVDVHAIGQESE